MKDFKVYISFLLPKLYLAQSMQPTAIGLHHCRDG
jgi:hypothetical protein